MKSPTKYEIKDSGKRIDYKSGMRRDTTEGKPRYDLIPHQELYELAMHYAGGAIKYGDSNWQLANSEEELQRFKSSLLRHAHQVANDETDEDHVSAVVFNAFAVKYLRRKLRDGAKRKALEEYIDKSTGKTGADVV